MPPLSWRLGEFFLFIGLLALFVFIVGLQAGSPSLAYCLFGLFFVILGGYALFRGRRPGNLPDTRFQAVRKLRSKGKKK
jgi:hypothetical protein